jgi:hypothetical protein
MKFVAMSIEFIRLGTGTKVVDSCENDKNTLNLIIGGEFDYLRD